jgi:hypothetical protein
MFIKYTLYRGDESLEPFLLIRDVPGSKLCLKFGTLNFTLVAFPLPIYADYAIVS